MVYSKYAGTEITLENKDHVLLKVTGTQQSNKSWTLQHAPCRI